MDTSRATLYTRVLVFPLPAPATIKSGPPSWVTASCWALFKSFSKSGILSSFAAYAALFEKNSLKTHAETQKKPWLF
jgi:hypothetical protein